MVRVVRKGEDGEDGEDGEGGDAYRGAESWPIETPGDPYGMWG